MAASQKDLCKAGAAAMANATRGRKTTFKSAKTIRTSCRISEFEEEIAEALETFRKGQRAG